MVSCQTYLIGHCLTESVSNSFTELKKSAKVNNLSLAGPCHLKNSHSARFWFRFECSSSQDSCRFHKSKMPFKARGYFDHKEYTCKFLCSFCMKMRPDGIIKTKGFWPLLDLYWTVLKFPAHSYLHTLNEAVCAGNISRLSKIASKGVLYMNNLLSFSFL